MQKNSGPLQPIVRWELSIVNNWVWGPSKTPHFGDGDAELKELSTS